MTKTELVKSIASQTGLSQRDVGDVFSAMEMTIVNTLAAGNSVAIPGVGKLKVVHCGERPGRNPRTGEPAVVPARRTVRLSVTSSLKQTIL